MSSKESIYKIRKICNIKYNRTTLPAAIGKCKILLKDCRNRCLCSILPSILRMESIEFSNSAIELCNKNCGFCQIKTEHLYDMIKNLPFYIIQRVIPLKTIEKKTEFLLSILENHLYEMNKYYIQDIIEILFKPKKTNQTITHYIIEENILFRLTQVVRKNQKKKCKKDSIFMILYEIVKYVNSFSIDTNYIGEIVQNIMEIIDAIIEYNLFHQLDTNKISDLIFSYFQLFKQTLIKGFKKMIKNTSIIMEEEWMYTRKVLFKASEITNNYIKQFLLNYDRPICHIDAFMFSFILQLPIDEMTIVIKKINANCMVGLISSFLFKNTNYTFDLYVNPLHMINSVICKNMNLTNTMMQFVMYHRKPYIIYENENGQIGIDAGGLTRDFYTQYFLQLKENILIKSDEEYMSFGVDISEANSLQRIRFAGILTAYSMFREGISPNIRFHPILSYFIVNGSTIHIEDLLEFLSQYDIEYIRNTRKILELSSDEYIQYMDMQGEDMTNLLCPKEYLKTLIQERYITPPFIAFIRGFRDIFIQTENNVDIYPFITPNMIFEYMTGIENYKILGDSNSLESILKVDCGEDTSMTENKKNEVKGILLEVLDNLNQTNILRLKDFLRFWHGTHGIQDFKYVDLTLRILYGKDDLYGCFSSSTCFGKLYIHYSHLISGSRETIKNIFIGHIERTLENQQLVESAGLYMQMD